MAQKRFKAAVGDEAVTMNNPVWLRAQAEGAKRLFSTGEYSDLVVACKGFEWQVHKFQLCSQSDFFHTTCSGRFKVRRPKKGLTAKFERVERIITFLQEAHENRINLDEDEPQVVEAMLNYLYTGTYEVAQNHVEHFPSIVLDIHMFTIADKYFVLPLKALAERNFSARCENEWKTPQFAQAITAIYEIAPEDESLKQTIIRIINLHLKELFGKEFDYAAFREVLQSVPQFSTELLTALATMDEIQPPIKTAGADTSTVSFTCPYDGSTATKVIALGHPTTISCRQGHTYRIPWWKAHQQGQEKLPMPKGMSFKCPDGECGSVFSRAIPYGEAVSLTCLNGHYRNYFHTWWEQYRVNYR